MDEKNWKYYLGEISCLLQDYARQAKVYADHPKEGDSADFNAGFLMAYHQVIAVIKNQASFFDLTQNDIGLADIEPERDLI